jgi:hypothetical protein
MQPPIETSASIPHARTKPMSILSFGFNPFSSSFWPSPFTVEGAYWYLQIASLALIGLTLVTGGAAIVMGIWSSSRQTERFLVLEKDNIAAQKALEDERSERLKREEEIAQRSFNQGVGATNLKQFKGTEVVLVSLNDLECEIAANQLKLMLDMSGWRVVEWTRSDRLSDFGYGIEVFLNADFKFRDTAPVDAVEALVDEIKANGIFATRRGSREELPPNRMVIKVGLNPLRVMAADIPQREYWKPPNIRKPKL